VDEDKYMENSIGVQVKVLDTIIVKKTFEEVACRKSQPALHESGEHRVLVRIFLHRIWISRGGTPHIHLLLVEETAVHRRQKVFGLHFGFFSTPCLDSDAGEMLVALTLQQIQQLLHGTSFSRRRSSFSSTGMASFSKDSGFSLAFARGLQQRQTAAARVDLQSTVWWQGAQTAKSWPDLSQPNVNAEDGKP
jgi:hypothetical protein